MNDKTQDEKDLELGRLLRKLPPGVALLYWDKMYGSGERATLWRAYEARDEVGNGSWEGSPEDAIARAMDGTLR